MIKLAAASQTIVAGGSLNPAFAALTIETSETNFGACLDLKKTEAGGAFGGFRYFSPFQANDPVMYIGDNGNFYTRMAIIGSSNHTSTGENYRINPPTLDRAWIAIWSDIDVVMQARDSGLPGTRSYETLDTDGNYVHAVDNATGDLLWGSTTAKDVNGRPLYDTRMGRDGANALETDGAFTATSFVATTVTAPTVIGSTASGGNLTVNSTSHATKGNLVLNKTTTFVDTNGHLNIADTNAHIFLNAGKLQLYHGGDGALLNTAGNFGITNTSASGSAYIATNNINRMVVTAAGIFQFWDGATFAAGTTTGLKIGTATTQKIGFFNATPIVQPTLGAATAGVTSTATAQTMLQAVYNALRNLGLGS